MIWIKRIILCACCALIICALCSWVNPITVNVYDGTLRGSGALNGALCQYYITSYNVGVSSSGELINIGDTVVHGRVLIGSAEYDYRIFTNNESEVYYNGTWIPIEIVPAVAPATYPVIVYFGVFLALLVFVLVIFSIGRCFV